MALQLKQILGQRKMSVLALSKATGITQANLSNIANGKASPKLEILERIAEALGIAVADLVSDNHGESLTALIRHGNNYYSASSLDELEKVVHTIKHNEEQP